MPRGTIQVLPARKPRMKIPSYRHYKPKGLGVVRLDGHDHYLGTYGTPESRRRYSELIQDWLANRPKKNGRDGMAVETLAVLYLAHCRRRYRWPDGSPKTEVRDTELSLRPVLKLYGETLVADFSRRHLVKVREEMCRTLCRGVVNQRIGRITRMFRWAEETELTREPVYAKLKVLSGIPEGSGEATDHPKVQPVPRAHLVRVLRYLTAPLRAAVWLQYLTGMRAGEVLAMTAAQLDRAANPWVYRPTHHKTAHRGHVRAIYLGARCQRLLWPLLATTGYLFSPRHVGTSRASASGGRQYGERYTSQGLDKALYVACRKAGLPAFSSHQVRHLRLTEIELSHGLEAAQAVAGHSSPAVTRIYAHAQGARAAEVMRKLG